MIVDISLKRISKHNTRIAYIRTQQLTINSALIITCMSVTCGAIRATYMYMKKFDKDGKDNTLD